MARIDVGRITLNVEQTGDGPPFIFVPGLVGLLNAWQYQIDFFSKRYRCISFDHRGAGESDRPSLDSYSTQAIADDVIALMDTLGIEKAHVAGTSTGGAILQNLAIDYPDRLRCCIFSNTWTKADEYIMRVQTARRQIALAEGQEAYVKISSLFTNGANQFRYNLDRVMEVEKRSLETIAEPEVLAARLDMTMAHDRLSELSSIKNPALIIGTRDDATVPYYFSEDLHAAIEGSRLILVEEGGHYSFRRHSDEWNALVSPFLDVRDGAAIGQLVEDITSDGGGIDILVNSAGIAVKGIRTHELSEADWNEVIQVNLTGSFLCCRAVIPVMLENGGGSIINIASISGLIGHYPGFPMLTSAYGASKAGINGLTLQMAVEYGADNIRANAIAPGWHGGTNLAERFKGGMSNAEVARFEDSVMTGTPMGRRGTPQDLQGLVVYLASDASSYLTGQIIAHDGGWTAR